MTNSYAGSLNIALVAHDARKDALVDWTGEHFERLRDAKIYATGTTGERLRQTHSELDITALKSGPLGGDQQIGAMICEGRPNGLIFFVDPLSPMPHDVDVKALTRLAVVYDLPMACSPSTATMIINAL